MKHISHFILSGLVLILAGQSFACTTFLIAGKCTADGKPILYKNRDTKEMDNALALFNDGKYKYLAVVNGDNKSSKHAVWGGYNEAGFAIINSAAYNNNIGDSIKDTGMDGHLMKLALMNCCSLNDFECMLDTLKKPLGVDSNFGVIDAGGGAAYYETGNYKYVKYDANDPAVAPNGILIRTNHSMSADLSKGFGFNRFDNATRILNTAREKKSLTPQYLLKAFPRSLYHPRTKTDLSVNLPGAKDQQEFRFFMDFIPRFETASSFMIVGAKDRDHTQDAMMWTILGFPLTSVAVPAWLSAGELPKSVKMNAGFKAPICDAALKFKDECFPIKIDKGTYYINLSAVANRAGSGYMQLLGPIEDKIIEKANSLITDLEKGKKSDSDIPAFYSWIDDYLGRTYREQFNMELFNNETTGKPTDEERRN